MKEPIIIPLIESGKVRRRAAFIQSIILVVSCWLLVVGK